MADEDIYVIVDSLLDVRFMFRVRDGDDAFVPDRYVVASCLPNKARPDMDPGDILELKPVRDLFAEAEACGGACRAPRAGAAAAGVVWARRRSYQGVLEARSLFRVQEPTGVAG